MSCVIWIINRRNYLVFVGLLINSRKCVVFVGLSNRRKCVVFVGLLTGANVLCYLDY